MRRLAEVEPAPAEAGRADGLAQRTIEQFVALGVPGLVLLAALSATGFAGAAAITAGLASLGGPFGMLGGIGVLVILYAAAKPLASHGFRYIAVGVVRGLKAKGQSVEDIRAAISRIPDWLLTRSVRMKLDEALSSGTSSAAGA